jgi:hypothetical protein
VEDQSIKAASEDSARGRALGFTMAMLQRIFAEAVPDFSAEPCLRATLSDRDCSGVPNQPAKHAKHAKQPRLWA